MPVPAVLLLAALASLLATGPVPDNSRQMLLVTTADWSATDGVLQRYERAPGQAWEAVGDPVPVVVGRSGLGWGRGLHGGPAAGRGPVKAEGDGRAPAGAFRLSAAFGYGDSLATGLPYVPTPGLQCVDDRASASYNLVRPVGADPDWRSHETMRRRDGLYRIGAIVAHNGPGVAPGLVPGAPLAAEAPVAGGGSCIFLHVWRGPGSVTAGCTAMPDARLAEVLAWLDADADPVLVQLPERERRRRQRAWQLPGR